MPELSEVYRILNDMNRTIGRIEGTVTAIKEHQEDMAATITASSERIGTLETDKTIRSTRASMYGSVGGALSGSVVTAIGLWLRQHIG